MLLRKRCTRAFGTWRSRAIRVTPRAGESAEKQLRMRSRKTTDSTVGVLLDSRGLDDTLRPSGIAVSYTHISPVTIMPGPHRRTSIDRRAVVFAAQGRP